MKQFVIGALQGGGWQGKARVLLTEEEIQYQIDYAFKHNPAMPLEVLLKPLIASSCNVQAQKILEWGNEACPHKVDVVTGKPLQKRKGCVDCWAEFEKEVLK